MTKVLVTGGSGMVGHALQRLRPEWTYISSSDADLTNLIETKQLFELVKPDYVIHLAAIVGGLYRNMANNYSIFCDNVLINQNVLKCCEEYHIMDGIFILSTCIFPDNVEYPIDETKLHNGPPHKSNYGYSYAKRMLEVACDLYNQKMSANLKCLIPTNLYGIHDNFNLDDAHVIPGLIHRSYLTKQQNKPLVIKGTGIAKRQFLFVDDFARIIIRIFDTPDISFNSLICSPNNEITISKVVSLIQCGYSNEEYDSSFSDGQILKTANNEKLLSLFPDFSFTDIDTGINITINWFKDNYPNVRL